LSARDTVVVQEHLKSCTSCSAILADYRQIGQMLKSEGRSPIPPDLAARISAALDHAEVGETTASASRHNGLFSGFGSQVVARFAQQAAMLAAVSLVSVFATYGAMKIANRSDDIEHDILNAHLRSLLLDSPVQVASTDQHTVRPWFAGKVDFSPAVQDLTAAGFPLIGGRLDYVNDRRVGALVYKHDKHLINVFTWASPGSDHSAQLDTRNGYNIVSWTKQGVTYWAVSDLNTDELWKLQRAF
ncbi:MAG: anti-sigma factor, partial [Aestuariivirga sp.]